MDKILNFCGDEAVMNVVLMVFGLIVAAVLKIKAVKKYKLARLIQFLEIGVRDTYAEFVRHVKAGREDGKLTSEERDEAMRRALMIAKNLAAHEGLDLGKYYAKEFLPVLIEKIVRRNKAEGAASTSPLAVPGVPASEPELNL